MHFASQTIVFEEEEEEEEEYSPPCFPPPRSRSSSGNIGVDVHRLGPFLGVAVVDLIEEEADRGTEGFTAAMGADLPVGFKP